MWHYTFEQKTDIAPEKIWAVLANVAGWASVDHNIERIQISEPPGVGVPFKLKPKGGPTLSFVIGDFKPPHAYSDVCKMPLASMKTLHTIEAGHQTTVRVTIEITGSLAGFWGYVVGRKHAAGIPALTQRMLDFARVEA
jgi:hypothetical protein